MPDTDKLLTRSELAHGRKLVEAAFDGPWRYKQFEIECPSCNGGEGPECVNPECSGAGGGPPATFVEAPAQYPASDERPQIVATIEVPGLSDLAQQNGECICWLRNASLELIQAHERLLDLQDAVEFILETERARQQPLTIPSGDVVGYARSLGWKGSDAT